MTQPNGGILTTFPKNIFVKYLVMIKIKEYTYFFYQFLYATRLNYSKKYFSCLKHLKLWREFFRILNWNFWTLKNCFWLHCFIFLLFSLIGKQPIWKFASADTNNDTNNDTDKTFPLLVKPICLPIPILKLYWTYTGIRTSYFK